jgi:hypothetical protein
MFLLADSVGIQWAKFVITGEKFSTSKVPENNRKTLDIPVPVLAREVGESHVSPYHFAGADAAKQILPYDAYF